MAILSDQEIWSLLDADRLIIDPLPPEKAVQTSSVDLTLGNTFQVPEARGGNGAEVRIDFRVSGAAMDALNSHSNEVIVEDGNFYEMKPGGFVLARTRERITLPNFLAARVEGRSTPARLGLSVHQSAPTIHATYSGTLQLELTNAGPFTLKLYPGQSICQLVLEAMSLPSVRALDSIHQSSP